MKRILCATTSTLIALSLAAAVFAAEAPKTAAPGDRITATDSADAVLKDAKAAKVKTAAEAKAEKLKVKEEAKAAKIKAKQDAKAAKEKAITNEKAAKEKAAVDVNAAKEAAKPATK